MVNQVQNFRDAILKKRTRIEEINLILAQPIQKGTTTNSRRRLIEERLHLEQAVSELEQEVARLQNPNAGLLKLPDGVRSAGDPVGENPFRVGDPRHNVWNEVTLEAEEKWCRLLAESERTPAGPPVAVIVFVCERTAKRFDIWAERGVQVVSSDRDVRAYDLWLVVYAEAWLEDVNAKRLWHGLVPTTDLLAELRLILTKRVGWWKAEARRYLAERKADLSEETAPSSTRASRRQQRPVDQRKELIARLKARNPNTGARRICELIDQKLNKERPGLQDAIATLESWQKLGAGERSWVGLYDHNKTHNQVRSYVNKVPSLKTAKSTK